MIAAHQKPKLFSGVAVLGGMFTVDPQLASTFKVSGIADFKS